MREQEAAEAQKLEQEQQREAWRAEEERRKAQKEAMLQVDPQDLFRVGEYEGAFQEFDEAGIPTVDREGEPVSKKQRKKLAKLMDQHVKKREKGGHGPAAAGGGGGV